MPHTLYLGLDVQADISSFCLLSDDHDIKPSNGRVNLDGFPKLLEDAKPQFLACEFTGRLAIPYARIAQAAGMKVYFLDTVSRSAYTRLFGQTSQPRPVRPWLPFPAGRKTQTTRKAGLPQPFSAVKQPWEEPRSAIGGKALVPKQ